MNQITKYFSSLMGLFLVAMLSSCVKDRNNGAPDFSTLQPLMEIRDNISGIGNDAGLANFARATLSFPSTDEVDTAQFYVNLASVDALNHDLMVTVGVDAAALQAYNSDPANTVHFDAMPDSAFSIPQTEFTIPAGQHVVLVPVIFYPSKIDGSKSFMLPISITDAQGLNISGNYGTIYYHSIGNPLAGTYNFDPANPSTRYSYTGVISYSYPGPYPAGYSLVDLTPLYPKTASPLDPTTISILYSNGFGPNYLITFDPSTLAITNVTLDDLSAISNFVVYYANYDPATKTIHIISHYNNVNSPAGSGDDRIIDEILVHE